MDDVNFIGFGPPPLLEAIFGTTEVGFRPRFREERCSHVNML